VLYVVTEMGSSLIVYNISKDGKLTHIMNTSTLPAAELTKGYGSKAAELVMSSDGSVLYASNRAFNDNFTSSVAVFTVSDDGLSVTLKDHVTTAAFPRGMAIANGGAASSVLVVESQTKGTVDTYKVGGSGSVSAIDSAKGPPGASSVIVLQGGSQDFPAPFLVV
jgi:6-phosphogluconolactonase (cycloisomerase 2 family)